MAIICLAVIAGFLSFFLALMSIPWDERISDFIDDNIDSIFFAFLLAYSYTVATIIYYVW
jgi:hypothetical protein